MAMRAADIRRKLAEILTEHQPQHLVFVGAHDGEEVPHILDAGVPRLTLVEPIPHLAAGLRARHAHDQRITVVEAACSDQTGAAVLHVPAKTNMASLVELAGDTIKVVTRRLDDIAPDADAAVIDVQGHEYEVLSAAPWDSLRLLMIETCTIDDPTLSPLYEPMVDYMRARGFRETTKLTRDYDWIQKWAYGKTTTTGAQVHDVVFARD